jgi:PAS domain S-box-containing protein
VGLLHERASQVAEREAVQRRILQNMTNGLVVIDEEGKVRLLNRAGEKLLGCKEGEVLGSAVEDVLGSGADKVRDSLDRALVYSGEEIVVKRGGRESMPLRISLSPLRDDGGKLNGVVVMLSDLREEKALEEERRRLDRLAFLGEISAVMAHEIRNPLAGMGAGLQHLLTKFQEGDGKLEAVERILKEGERVNRIIEDILLISRPPQLNLAPCDISEVIEEVIGVWEERARGQGVEIRRYYASELPMVRGDKVRLHQAFSNLISNGVEAMLDGGELSIAVTGPGREDVVGDGEGSALWGEDGHVEVEIRDTGVGIKKEEMGKIFEPFYTTSTRGMGLGLAITRRIINEHGGEIEVESEEGVGTRFVVRLPMAMRGG